MIDLILLLLSLVSSSHLTSSKSNQSVKFEYIYDPGLYAPNGMLAIAAVTVKSPKEKPYRLSFGPKSLQVEKPHAKHFGLKYVPYLHNSITDTLENCSLTNVLGAVFAGDPLKNFQVKGSTGTKVNRIRGTIKESYIMDETNILCLQVETGDELQLIDLFGLTDTIIGLNISTVTRKVFKNYEIENINSKFETITKYNLSNGKPIVTEILTENLEKESHRFKWFTTEKQRPLLPKVTHPNFTMKFTESSAIISSMFNKSTTRIKLVKDYLQIEIDKNSPFLVLIKSKEIKSKRRITPATFQIITGKESIKVKCDDEIVIFNFHQPSEFVFERAALFNTKEELVKHLETHNLMDNIYITAQIVKNTKVPERQEIESFNNTNNTIDTNNTNNTNNTNTNNTSNTIDTNTNTNNITNTIETNTFQNNKNFDTEKVPESEPETLSELGSFKLQEKKIDLNSNENVPTLETISSINSLFQDQISVKPRDRVIKIENNDHEIDLVEKELSDRLEKIDLSQPPVFKPKVPPLDFNLSGNKSLKSSSNTGFVYVYDLGLDSPEGSLGISRMTVKIPNGKLGGISLDNKSLYLAGISSTYTAPRYFEDNFEFTKECLRGIIPEDALGVVIISGSGEFHIKGPVGTKVNHICGNDEKSYFIGECNTLQMEAKDGDEFQIINPLGLNGAAISLKLGMVKDIGQNIQEMRNLQFKIDAVNRYKLSAEKPIVKEIPSTPLEKASHRFKWFTNEEERSLLPSVSYPNGIMEFTESALIFSNSLFNSTTRIELFGNKLRIEIDENSPFAVLVRSIPIIYQGKIIPGKEQSVIKGTSSITIKEGDKIIILNITQKTARIPAKLELPATRKELITQLEKNNLMDSIQIIACIAKNTKAPNVQETTPKNNTNNSTKPKTPNNSTEPKTPNKEDPVKGLLNRLKGNLPQPRGYKSFEAPSLAEIMDHRNSSKTDNLEKSDLKQTDLEELD